MAVVIAFRDAPPLRRKLFRHASELLCRIWMTRHPGDTRVTASPFHRQQLAEIAVSRSWHAFLVRPLGPNRSIGEELDKYATYYRTRLKTAMLSVRGPIPVAQRHPIAGFIGETVAAIGNGREVARVV